MNDDLLTGVEAGVATITFNRPKTLNALDPAYLARFITAFRALEDDASVRVIVLTGAGRAFSSGGDRGFLNELVRLPPEKTREIVYRHFLGAARAVKLSTKPTIAAVNGAAIGAGCELAVACDFRVVSREAFFCENWIELGLIPPLGGMFLLPRLIGLERATNMVLRAQRVYGEEALRIGLATACVEPAALAGAALEIARELAARSPRALAAARQGLRRGLEGSLEGEWEFNLQTQSMLFTGRDFGEAVAAMNEKRKAVF
ncbi:MAG TPA: enoyl-CoA hydratase/isomerase family protein [Burkholderiales bacterium]